MILPSFQRIHIQLKSGKLSNQNLIRSYPIHCSACLHMYIMHLHLTAYIVHKCKHISLSVMHIYHRISIYIYMFLYNKRYIYIIMVIHGSIFTIVDVLNQPWLRFGAALGFPARAARLLARRMPRPRSASPDSAAPGRPSRDVRWTEN